MSNDKLTQESVKILAEKLGKELKKLAKTSQVGKTPGDTTTMRTYIRPSEEEANLSPKAKAKLKSHRSREDSRHDSDTSWAVDLPSGHQKQRWGAQQARERKHREARGVKTRGAKATPSNPKDVASKLRSKHRVKLAKKRREAEGKVEENITFKHFCEALKHVKGSNLAKALEKVKTQSQKSREEQESLPTDKYGGVDDKQWEKHEGRQYRLDRARTEIEGEVAQRLRKQGVRAASNVSNPEREAQKAGDMLKPRAKKPNHKKRLKGSAVITVKPKVKKKGQAQIGFKS
tara:strand:+ start:5471 stop:6337 length:867 start_codon:yes stop_codon:yes gene_type:complete